LRITDEKCMLLKDELDRSGSLEKIAKQAQKDLKNY
jgi:hypothetical protein